MSNTEAIRSESIDLWGWGHEYDDNTLPQRIFGELVRLATPVVKEFHSDLYHDALWIKSEITGPTSFMYLVRHSGTSLGSCAPLYFESVHYDAMLYNIDLSVDERGRWTLRIDTIGERPARP